MNTQAGRNSSWHEFKRRRRTCAVFVLSLPLLLVYVVVIFALQKWEPNNGLVAPMICPLFVIVPGWFLAYLALFSRVMYWPCPQCGRYFCSKPGVVWPFTSTCLHCGASLPGTDGPHSPSC